MNTKIVVLFTLTIFTIISCIGINTTKPIEFYNYWTGNSNQTDIELNFVNEKNKNHMEVFFCL